MEHDDKYIKKALKFTRDLIVKLSRVYKKDFYIIDGSYLYPGKLSVEEISGYMVCEIEEPYKEYLKELEITNEKFIYISDIKTFKDDFTAKNIIDNETNYNQIRDEMFSFIDSVKKIPVWNSMNINLDTLFTLKEIVELESNRDDIPNVIIGNDMLPLVTEKNIQDLYYCCDIEKIELKMKIYKVIFDFTIPHFRLMYKYNYVSVVD